MKTILGRCWLFCKKQFKFRRVSLLQRGTLTGSTAADQQCCLPDSAWTGAGESRVSPPNSSGASPHLTFWKYDFLDMHLLPSLIPAGTEKISAEDRGQHRPLGSCCSAVASSSQERQERRKLSIQDCYFYGQTKCLFLALYFSRDLLCVMQRLLG